MRKIPAAAFVLLLGAACRRPPAAKPGEPGRAFEPSSGRRAFSLAVDKSQARFLEPGDAAELLVLAEAARPDGTREARSKILARRAEVLRVRRDWDRDTSLIQLALSPEEAQDAALAADREDRVLLEKLPGGAPHLAAAGKEGPVPPLAPGMRGAAVLVYPDQEEFLVPGRRVDVASVREAGRPDSSGKRELAALTLFQNVRVLGAAPAADDQDWASVELELAPAQADALARAGADGDDLFLEARAPNDRATRPVEPTRLSRRFESSDGSSAPPQT